MGEDCKSKNRKTNGMEREREREREGRRCEFRGGRKKSSSRFLLRRDLTNVASESSGTYLLRLTFYPT